MQDNNQLWKIILNEINRGENSTSRKLSKGTLKLLLKTHPLTKDIAGSPETLKNIKREDLVAHYKNILPQNFYVFSCGDTSIKNIVKAFEGALPYKKIERV